MPIIKNKRTKVESNISKEALEEMKGKSLMKRFTVISKSDGSDYIPPEVKEVAAAKPKPKSGKATPEQSEVKEV